MPPLPDSAALPQLSYVVAAQACYGCLLLPEVFGEYRLVDGKNDHHRDAARHYCGDDIANAVRYVESRCHGIPDTGEQVHDKEHAQGSREMAEDLTNDRSLAAEGHVALQREVYALTQNDRGEVGQCEGQTTVRKTVSDNRQSERHPHHLDVNAWPGPGDIAYHASEKRGKEGQQSPFQECDDIAKDQEQASFTDPLGCFWMFFCKITHVCPPINVFHHRIRVRVKQPIFRYTMELLFYYILHYTPLFSSHVYIESRPPAKQGGHIGMHSYTHVCCNDFYTSWQHMRAMDV